MEFEKGWERIRLLMLNKGLHSHVSIREQLLNLLSPLFPGWVSLSSYLLSLSLSRSPLNKYLNGHWLNVDNKELIKMIKRALTLRVKLWEVRKEHDRGQLKVQTTRGVLLHITAGECVPSFFSSPSSLPSGSFSFYQLTWWCSPRLSPSPSLWCVSVIQRASLDVRGARRKRMRSDSDFAPLPFLTRSNPTQFLSLTMGEREKERESKKTELWDLTPFKCQRRIKNCFIS